MSRTAGVRTKPRSLLLVRTRRFACAGLLCLLACPALMAAQPAHRPAPRPAPPAPHPAARPTGNAGGANRANQPHLSQWMESHRNLPPAQQQSALESEPGFRDLKPQEQERMRNLVTRLNTMPADQRQRTIARTEWMERLQPTQRQQVRGAMAQLGSLPPDRAHAVGRLFRSLQTMPEPERQAYLNSPQFHAMYSDQERATLSNLMTVAPLIPPPVPAQPIPGMPR